MTSNFFWPHCGLVSLLLPCFIEERFMFTTLENGIFVNKRPKICKAKNIYLFCSIGPWYDTKTKRRNSKLLELSYFLTLTFSFSFYVSKYFRSLKSLIHNHQKIYQILLLHNWLNNRPYLPSYCHAIARQKENYMF